jgi:hypothetical protein
VLQVKVNTADMLALLQRADRRATDALEAAQFRLAGEALERAGPHTPFKTGALRASRAQRRTRPIEAAFTAPYAAVVHDRQSVHAIGKWKYLEAGLAELDPQGRLVELWRDCFARGMTLQTAPALFPENPPTAQRRGR